MHSRCRQWLHDSHAIVDDPCLCKSPRQMGHSTSPLLDAAATTTGQSTSKPPSCPTFKTALEPDTWGTGLAGKASDLDGDGVDPVQADGVSDSDDVLGPGLVSWENLTDLEPVLAGAEAEAGPSKVCVAGVCF